ncbi:hypothetical protein CY34DRAFT_812601 [Suillus luteus UH-Slu-Lm8-n1]|uniref:Uncharacterized protein n=1 Tax=Suillus luteus UH-Slu-Lm8-n1 TaxID=930992 RepID=A0A0C9ZZC4_9AGAM|nr:hypothetical protein CY34DRAFT_812601 [Suillus luteus UH-Slu-Lm8-n1]
MVSTLSVRPTMLCLPHPSTATFWPLPATSSASLSVLSLFSQMVLSQLLILHSSTFPNGSRSCFTHCYSTAIWMKLSIKLAIYVATFSA